MTPELRIQVLEEEVARLKLAVSALQAQVNSQQETIDALVDMNTRQMRTIAEMQEAAKARVPAGG